MPLTLELKIIDNNACVFNCTEEVAVTSCHHSYLSFWSSYFHDILCLACVAQSYNLTALFQIDNLISKRWWYIMPFIFPDQLNFLCQNSHRSFGDAGSDCVLISVNLHEIYIRMPWNSSIDMWLNFNNLWTQGGLCQPKHFKSPNTVPMSLCHKFAMF